MLPIQFALDDFAEIVDAIRRPLAAEQAELAAVQQKIGGLTQTLAAQVRAAKALDQAIDEIEGVEDQCDCDWWCWLLTGEAVNLALGAALAVALTLGAAAGSAVVAGGANGILGLGGVTLVALSENAISCADVVTIGNSMKTARAGLQAAIADNQAELSHALARRDILIASINALSQQLEEVYQSNAARALDAKTLDLIQAQYNALRQSLLTRAQAVAKLAENAFNFERDADTHLIKDAYYNTALKGYTAAETLLHDLTGLDQIDLTGRTQKAEKGPLLSCKIG